MSRGRGRGSPAVNKRGSNSTRQQSERQGTRSTSGNNSGSGSGSGSENEENENGNEMQEDGSPMEEVKPVTTTTTEKTKKKNDKGKERDPDNAGNSAAGGGGGGGGGGVSTDLHALDDAVGMAGVDLNAEEEAIRASNQRTGAQQQGQGQNINRARIRPRLILDEQALKDAVLRIAASFHLKNLESDSLPLIGLAVQMRIRTLIESMIRAKTHRTSSVHLRPPPMYPARFEGDIPAPMWDTVLYDDVEKILSTFDRVEKEEERQARKDRLARDQREQEERERQDRLAQERGEEGPEASTSATPAGDYSMADNSFGGNTPSLPGTPMSGNFNDLKGKGKAQDGNTEKKRKRETPAQQAKNMSEDVRKRLSDQTAQRKLGGKKFSWLSGGPGGPSTPGGGTDSPSGKRGKTKFPPLPPSSLSISTSLPSPNALPSLSTPGIGGGFDSATTTVAGDTPLTANPLTGRLLSGVVPNLHEASQSTEDPANRVITIRDALFVMEHERGKGAGTGSGTRPMARAYMGRT